MINTTSRRRNERKNVTVGGKKWQKSEQHAFDPAGIGLADVIGHPVVAKQVFGQFDDDVVRLGVGIVVIAGQTLQTGRAGGQNLDIAGEKTIAASYLLVIFVAPPFGL